MLYFRLRMWAATLAIFAGMALGGEAICASRLLEPLHLTVEVPASAVLIGDATTRAHWSRHIQASPDADGEFEILIARNKLANIEAPHCPSPWLLARMPAVLPPTDSASRVMPRDAENQNALKRNLATFSAILDAVARGQAVRLSLSALSYGRPTGKGLLLDYCNLFIDPL